MFFLLARLLRPPSPLSLVATIFSFFFELQKSFFFLVLKQRWYLKVNNYEYKTLREEDVGGGQSVT